MSYVDCVATSCRQPIPHFHPKTPMVSQRMSYLRSYRTQMVLEKALGPAPVPVSIQELNRQAPNRWFRSRHLMSHLIRLTKTFVRLAVAVAWDVLASHWPHPLTSYLSGQLPFRRWM